MKKILQPLKTTLLTLILIVSTGLVTMAATYTATTSGNWSSAGTWGGTAPSFNITGADVVIIPLGICLLYTSGPISRIIEMATMPGNHDSAPNRASVGRD